MKDIFHNTNTGNEYLELILEEGDVASDSLVKKLKHGSKAKGFGGVKMPIIEREYQAKDGYTYILRRNSVSRSRNPLRIGEDHIMD